MQRNKSREEKNVKDESKKSRKNNTKNIPFTYLSVLPECPHDGSPPGDTVAWISIEGQSSS